MTLYHVTSPAAADDIRVRGFTGSIDPDTGIAGVRFADRPIGFTHAHGAVVVIEIPEHL